MRGHLVMVATVVALVALSCGGDDDARRPSPAATPATPRDTTVPATTTPATASATTVPATTTPMPEPYVGEGSEGNVSWGAGRPSSGGLVTRVWIKSEPWTDESGEEREAVLELYCGPGLRSLMLKTGGPQGGSEVSWSVGDGPTVTEVWEEPYWGKGGEMLPPLSGKMIQNLKGASRFTITTNHTPELVFHLEGALETPAQVNIDNCGRKGWR